MYYIISLGVQSVPEPAPLLVLTLLTEVQGLLRVKSQLANWLPFLKVYHT